jgi:hypothetical protein
MGRSHSPWPEFKAPAAGFVKENRFLRFPVARSLRRGVHPGQPKSNTSRLTMRAEIQKLVDEIKQSIGLLRRHL